jgi:hypothetical protein
MLESLERVGFVTQIYVDMVESTMRVFPGANQEQIRVFKEYEGRRRGGNSVGTPTRIVRNNSRL